MFEYTCKLSLWIRHPAADLSHVPEKLGFPATRVWKAGDPRLTPKGMPLIGNYRESYCSLSLQEERVASLPDLLRNVLPKLSARKADLDKLTSSGATISLFVGWFSEDTNSRDVIDWELLAELAKLKISLDLDFYGPEETTPQTVEDGKT
ncbi:MAG TPA: DUF4279 domain-containing protein [Rhizomicrobium sp.]